MAKAMSGKKISIRQGDITTFDVDAIVNAAHNALLGGGGVDGAIHKASGPGLLQECREFPVDDNGTRCKTGEAYITKGYNLPSKYVIHTVAPKFIGGIIRKIVNGEPKAIFTNETKEEDDAKMAECYRNCMHLADENCIRTIAFPSLGTGGHAYPIEVACPIAINTVRECLKTAENVKQVIFVCFSDDDYQFYGEKAKEILN